MAIFPKARKTLLNGLAILSLSGCQASHFYFPSKEKFFDPASLNLRVEDIFLKTSSGENIHGWYFPAVEKNKSKGTLLFFHGNAENLSSHFLMFHWLPSNGYNFFIIDYPGYGRSSGKPTPKGTVEAGIAAINWIYQQKDSRPLIIYGHSLGGIVALRTVEEVKDSIPIKNVVIEASFSSYQQIARAVMKRSWYTWILQPMTPFLVSDKYAPKSLASISPIPLLFIHGTDDEVIDIQSTEEMYKKAHEPKDFWIISHGHHGDLYEVDKGLRERFLAYLSETSTSSP